MRLKVTILSLSILAFLTSVLTSCGGSGKSSDTANIVVDTALATDSASFAKNDSVKKAEAPERKFSGTAEELEFMRNSGKWEAYQSGILPRMAEEVPDYAGKLLNNKYEHFIVVDKAAMKVILYDKYGRMVKEYPCAASKNYGNKKRKGDSRTAEGYFTAEGVYDSTDWLFTNDAGYTSPARGQFGPRFIRLKGAPQIGIHGTASPGSIGRRVSHGCVRLTNENILDLVKYAKAGMPIIVSPGPQDMRVNNAEGTPVPAVTTGATKVVPAAAPPVSEKQKNKQEAKTINKKEIDSASPQTGTVTPAETSTPAETKSENAPKEEKKEQPTTPPAEPSQTPANS